MKVESLQGVDLVQYSLHPWKEALYIVPEHLLNSLGDVEGPVYLSTAGGLLTGALSALLAGRCGLGMLLLGLGLGGAYLCIRWLRQRHSTLSRIRRTGRLEAAVELAPRGDVVPLAGGRVDAG